MKQGELNNDWYVIPVGDDYFLIRILKYGSVYVGAVMDFDQFMKPSSEVEGRSSYLVYATQDGQALNQKNLLEEKQIELKQNSKGYYITGKGMERYLVVYEQLPYGDLVQYYISPYGSFWNYQISK